MNEVQGKAPGSGALVGGWICFGIGVSLMLLSLFLFLIYAPLFLASFILGIVAMSQKRVAAGLILLLGSLLVPLVLGVGLGSARYAEFRAQHANESAPSDSGNPELQLVDFTCKQEGSYAKIEGHLKNSSARRLDNLRVTGSFYAKGGQSLGSESTIVDFTALLPGQSTPFHVIGPRVATYEKCGVDGITEGMFGKTLRIERLGK